MGEDFSWLDWFQRMAGNEQYPMTEPGSAVGGGMANVPGYFEKRYMPQAYFEETDPMARREGLRGKIDAGVEAVLGRIGFPNQGPGGNLMGNLEHQRGPQWGPELSDAYNQKQAQMDALIRRSQGPAGR